MKTIREWLQGKKTYIVLAVAFVFGGLQACGVEVPAVVYEVLAFLGIGAVGAKIDRAVK